MIWRSIALLCCFFLAGLVGLWVSDRTDPVTFNEITAVTPVVAPGGVLKVRYDVQRHRACALKVERILYDSERIHWPLADRDFMTSPGDVGNDWYVVAVMIPLNTAPGLASYRMATSYICNPVHKLWPIVTTTRDVSFLVRGDPVTDQTRAP